MGAMSISYVYGLIVGGGRSREKHDQNLELVLRRLSGLNMNMNEIKCKYLSHTCFYWDITSLQGIIAYKHM